MTNFYLQAATSAADPPKFDDWICFCFCWIGFYWKWCSWCIPNPNFCVVQPCRFFVPAKHDFHTKNMFFTDFMKIDLICHQIEKPSMQLTSWNLQNFGGYPKSLQWSSHDSISWEVGHIINIWWVCGMLGCPLAAVDARRFAGMWRPVPARGARLDAPLVFS